jgi:hypothetical protein
VEKPPAATSAHHPGSRIIVTVAPSSNAANVNAANGSVFGNRSTLLVEMARRIDRTSGFLERLAAARRGAPRAAFRRMLNVWFDYIPTILPVARDLEASALTTLGIQPPWQHLPRISECFGGCGKRSAITVPTDGAHPTPVRTQGGRRAFALDSRSGRRFSLRSARSRLACQIPHIATHEFRSL